MPQSMNSLRPKFHSLISKSLISHPQCRRFAPLSQTLLSKLAIHTHPSPNPANDVVVKAICDSFRAGSSWEVLASKFHNLDLDEPLVERILLELRDPIDAKRALGFFHWSARKKSFNHGVGTYCLAINVLVRARMNFDAKALIESVLKKKKKNDDGHCCRFSVVDSLLDSYGVSGSNPFVFDLLVQGYSRLRMFEEGFEVCCYLERRGFCLSLASFNSLLHVAQRSDCDSVLVWKIYEHMIRVRVYPNEETVRVLISCLCKEGKLVKSVQMLDRICGKKVSPFVVVNSSLVFGVLEQGRVEEGMVLLKRMLVKNMLFDTIAYSLVVYAKVRFGDLGGAREVYEEMLKRGFRPNPFVQTLFIGTYCEEGRVEEARCLMRDMEETGMKPYEETYNNLVKGFANVGRLEESLGYCERMMEKGFVPSCSAFNKMVEGLCKNGDVEKANATLTLLLEMGFAPNETTYSCLVDGYGKNGDTEEVIKLFYEMESRSLPPGPSVFSTLIKSLCRSKKLEEAGKYLRIMKERSLVGDHEHLYQTLISSYIEKGDTKRAFRLHKEMALEEK